jgi:hypothetical protein
VCVDVVAPAGYEICIYCHPSISTNRYFIFLNSSVKGPFLPAWVPPEWHWTAAYLSAFQPEPSAAAGADPRAGAFPGYSQVGLGFSGGGGMLNICKGARSACQVQGSEYLQRLQQWLSRLSTCLPQPRCASS